MADSLPDSSVADPELRLLYQFEPLIRAASARLKVRAQDREDALQAGRVALLIASRKFDPVRGVPFGAYASPYVTAAIRKAIYGTADGRTPKGAACATAQTTSISLDEVREKFAVTNQPSPERLLLHAERDKVIGAFVDSLPSTEQAAVLDAVWNSRSQASTAQALGLSQPGVHKAWKRALRKGSEALGNYADAA